MLAPSFHAPTVLLDHMSSHGPQVTHLRGILLVKSVENLRASGLFEAYAAKLAPALREQVEFALATSWIPMDVCEAHYAACDQLALSQAEIERLGVLMAEGISSTTMSALLKSVRQSGVEGVWTALKQSGRFWDRNHKGGGVTLLQAGPKDSILEYHGIPLAKSRYWRMAARAFWIGLGRVISRVTYVKLTQPREPHPHRIAFSGSWV